MRRGANSKPRLQWFLKVTDRDACHRAPLIALILLLGIDCNARQKTRRAEAGETAFEHPILPQRADSKIDATPTRDAASGSLVNALTSTDVSM